MRIYTVDDKTLVLPSNSNPNKPFSDINGNKYDASDIRLVDENQELRVIANTYFKLNGVENVVIPNVFGHVVNIYRSINDDLLAVDGVDMNIFNDIDTISLNFIKQMIFCDIIITIPY